MGMTGILKGPQDSEPEKYGRFQRRLRDRFTKIDAPCFFYNYKAAKVRRIAPMVKAEEKKAEEVDKLNL